MNHRSATRRLMETDALLWLDGKTIRARTRDISQTGVYFYGDFPVTTTFKFAIQLPAWTGAKAGTVLRGDGRFVRYDLLDSRRVGFAATIEHSRTLLPRPVGPAQTATQPAMLEEAPNIRAAQRTAGETRASIDTGSSDLEDYVGWAIRVSGPRFQGSALVRLLAVRGSEILVSEDSGEEPFWVALTDVTIG